MKSNTLDTSAPTPTQFKFPVITIPEDVTLCEYGRLQFYITTSDGGVIACNHWRHGITCEGKLDTLVTAGIMLPKWAPGLPGNNKTCQRVAFDEGQPRLILRGKGGQRLKIPHISIMKKSRITFEVAVPTTEKQDAWIKNKERELKQEMAYKKAVEIASTAPEEVWGVTPERAHAALQNKVRGIPDYIEYIFRGSEHGYSFNSMNRIKSSLEALGAALASAQIVRLVPKYPRVGNVIEFPQISR